MPKDSGNWTLIDPGKTNEELEIVNVDEQEEEFDVNKEISQKFNQQEQNEDEDDENEVIDEDDSSDEEYDADEDDNVDEESKKKSSNRSKNNNKRRRGDRAQKRIQNLVAEKKALEAALQKAREENSEAQKTVSSERKRAVEVARTSLESKLKSLDSELVKASDEGDTAKMLQLTRQLSETEYSLRELKNVQIPDPDTEIQKTPLKETSDTPSQPSREDILATLPEYGQDWIEDNPKFWNDMSFRKRAIGYGSALEEEGYDPNTQEYWDELENKMQGNSRKSTKERNSSGKTRKRRAPTGSSSRVSRSSNNKTTVKLSNEELSLARRLGISKEAYAQRVIEHEENTNSKNGYTTISIPGRS